MDSTLIKVCIRKEVRAAVRLFTREYMDAACSVIAQCIRSLEPYTSAKTVFCYVSTEHEVNTRDLIARALSEGKRVCVPRCAGAGDMRPTWISGLDELAPGAYGIPEPPLGASEAAPHQIDLAVVPCACCTHSGDRLGHGGGYYDRFLTDFSGVTLMLCFERLIRGTVPMEDHDRPADYVVTEQGVWFRGKRIDV